MAFNSSIFLVWFLPVFFALYLLLKKQGVKNFYLLITSLLIYAWAEPYFVFVLLASTCIDFYLVKWMSLQSNKRKKQIILSISISINVGLLILFKYYDFFASNINQYLKDNGYVEWPILELILPLGISFYTFETITYVVDVYRGVHRPQDKLWNYLLYIFLFPKMIAGPIIRYHEIADQINDRTQQETIDLRLNGFYRFCIGLAKKVLIANQLAMYGVDKIFYENPNSLNGMTAWIGAIGYTMQIYFDFSAYSDMALGLGKMVGFQLPENFSAPYVSKSITEFWRRWHISLGKWMKNYLYIPLGGNKNGTFRLYLNLWIVFLISGLWHRASWSFIIWGAIHGFFIVVERLFLYKLLAKIPAIISISYTFLIVCLASVLFRIDDLDKSLDYFAALGFSNNVTFEAIRPEFWAPFFIALIFSFLPYFKIGEKLQNYFYSDAIQIKRHLVLTSISIILFILAISFNTRVGLNPFIYFRF
jgi:alginate O-acetyltransferase complex protein AlgI